MEIRPDRGNHLFMWVIYEHPSDYPCHVVLRRWWAAAGVVAADNECSLHLSIEEARAALPPGLYCIGRSAGDQPQIREVWI